MASSKGTTKKSATSRNTEETGESLQKSNNSKVRRITTTDPQLEVHLKNRNIVAAKLANPDQKPTNFAEVIEMLKTPRSLSSPVTPKALEYQKRMDRAKAETHVHAAIGNILPVATLATHDYFCCTEKQYWSERVKPYKEPPDEYLIPPTPDYSIGMMEDVLCSTRMPIIAMGGYAVPLAKFGLAFPFFMIEAKSDEGRMEEARLQNSLNGAIAVNNILQLKKRTEQDFYGQGKVFTVCVNPFMVHLRVHWVIRDGDRNKFLDRLCGSWNTHFETEGFMKARQQLLNILDWLELSFGPELQEDMKVFEECLTKEGWTHETVKPPNTEQAPATTKLATAQPASGRSSVARQPIQIPDNDDDELAH